VYVQKQTTELSVEDCRDLKRASILARDQRHPLNTLVTFMPYHSLPSPKARAKDLNRLLTYLRTWMRRHLGSALYELHVWHSDVTGRNPHVHIFMHCPKRWRDELRQALDKIHPEPRVIDVSAGADIRKTHHTGHLGSTLDYLMRFQSQQAWWGGGKKTWRESIRDENGRRRGVKSPITGKRWGCTETSTAMPSMLIG